MTKKEKQAEIARRFGTLVREARRSAGLTQNQLALATGTGRRFIISLESGNPNCRIGLSLAVAEALGIEFPGLDPRSELPDLPDDDTDEDEDVDTRPRLGEFIRSQS